MKLIYHYRKTGNERYQLFDLAKDPYEKNNLASENMDEVKLIVQLFYFLDHSITFSNEMIIKVFLNITFSKSKPKKSRSKFGIFYNFCSSNFQFGNLAV